MADSTLISLKWQRDDNFLKPRVSQMHGWKIVVGFEETLEALDLVRQQSTM